VEEARKNKKRVSRNLQGIQRDQLLSGKELSTSALIKTIAKLLLAQQVFPQFITVPVSAQGETKAGETLDVSRLSGFRHFTHDT
jgi:hypothetical protein